MKIYLIAASALALASPAIAQTTGAPIPSTGAVAQDSVPAAAQAAQPAPAAAPVEAAPVGADQVIAAEFPTYDKNGDDALSRSEFTAWMTALKAKSGEPAMKSAELKSWTATAFASADADKNKAISKTELTTFLTAGA